MCVRWTKPYRVIDNNIKRGRCDFEMAEGSDHFSIAHYIF